MCSSLFGIDRTLGSSNRLKADSTLFCDSSSTQLTAGGNSSKIAFAGEFGREPSTDAPSNEAFRELFQYIFCISKWPPEGSVYFLLPSPPGSVRPAQSLLPSVLWSIGVNLNDRLRRSGSTSIATTAGRGCTLTHGFRPSAQIRLCAQNMAEPTQFSLEPTFLRRCSSARGKSLFVPRSNSVPRRAQLPIRRGEATHFREKLFSFTGTRSFHPDWCRFQKNLLRLLQRATGAIIQQLIRFRFTDQNLLCRSVHADYLFQILVLLSGSPSLLTPTRPAETRS